MGNILKTFLSVMILAIFIGVGANYVGQQKDKLQLKAIEVNNLMTDVERLNLKFNDLNEQLKDEKHLNKQQLEKLNKEKSEVEKEKKSLEQKLQAKAEAKSKLAKASEEVVNRATSTSTASALSGSKEQWLAASGIPQSEWQYVDYIVSKESGWNPCAYNPGQSDCSAEPTSACGLAQSLPCGKQSKYGHWTDPVANLKWQYEYVKERYGGYAQAYAFWSANKWY